MRLSPTHHHDTFTRECVERIDPWPSFVFALPELEHPPTTNAATELLDGAVARFGGDRRCLVTDAETWSYQDLLERSNQIAHFLANELGVVSGNRVLVRGPNDPWFVANWLAVIKVGAVAVQCSPRLRARELTHMVDIAKVSAALCQVETIGELAEVERSLQVVAYGGGDSADLTKRSAKYPVDHADVVVASDDVAMIQFTSGTTARPKATLHFHRDLLTVAALQARQVLRLRPDELVANDRTFGVIYSIGALIVIPMACGAASLLIPDATPESLFDAVERHGVDTLFTSPTVYRAGLAGAAPADLGRLSRCITAGEVLTPSTWHEWRARTGLEIENIFGTTEGTFLFLASQVGEIRPGALGKPIPGYEVRVMDQDGRPCAPGETGVLAMRGPTGCRYLDNPDRQSAAVRAGWTVTGDQCHVDEEGYFWIHGRTDDMIIVDGLNVAPGEIEDVLLEHPAVDHAAVVGVPDDGAAGSVSIYAFVTLNGSDGDWGRTRPNIEEFLRQSLAEFKLPRRIVRLDALPLTATFGKVDRNQLRQMTLDHR